MLEVRALVTLERLKISGSAFCAIKVFTNFKFEFCSSMVESFVVWGASAGATIVVAALLAFFDNCVM